MRTFYVLYVYAMICWVVSRYVRFCLLNYQLHQQWILDVVTSEENSHVVEDSHTSSMTEDMLHFCDGPWFELSLDEARVQYYDMYESVMTIGIRNAT